VETENGNSKLVKKSNNHFGIKCKETWTGPSVSHDDDAPQECFRKYGNAEESYIDHSNFLRTRKHYDFLFTLDPVDYKAWAYGLKKAGYATNPKYPDLLIRYIETYHLNDYSLIAMGKVKAEEPVVVKTEQPATVPAAPPVIPATVVTAPAVKVEEKKPAVVYPVGEFKINETRVIFASKGTPFLAIAQQYNVPLKYIFDFNDLTEKEAVEKDQLIYLQRKRRTGANPFHIVTDGESLYDIAQQQGIRLDALMQLNQLTVHQQPAIGEQLYLQAPAPAAPKLSTKKNTAALEQAPTETNPVTVSEIEIHVVQPKETLYSISKKYEVTPAQLQQWNNLSNADLKQGMELIINK
jgi:LysM repeat protein